MTSAHVALGVAGFVLLAVSFIPGLGGSRAGSWIQGCGAGLAVAVAVGLIAGRGAAATAAGEGGDGAGPAPGPGDTQKIYEARGSTCPKCRRPLLPGMKKCPFCEPVVSGAQGLESTLDAEHKPLEELVAMPGLALAAKQTRDVGARGYLHIFSGPNKGESVLLGVTALSIGRAPENTLILKDDGVSLRHAEVRIKGKSFCVQDLGSKNGTFVNDQRVAEAALSAGDVVSVGGTKMLFQG